MYRYTIARHILRQLRFSFDKTDGCITLDFPGHHTTDEFLSFLSQHYDITPGTNGDRQTARLTFRNGQTHDDAATCLPGFVQILASRYDLPAASLCDGCMDADTHAQLREACNGYALGHKLSIFDDPESTDLIVRVQNCSQRDAFCNWLEQVYECDRTQDGDGDDDTITLRLKRERFAQAPLKNAEDLVDLAVAMQNAWGIDRSKIIAAITPDEARGFADSTLNLRPAPLVDADIAEGQYAQDIAIIGGGFTGISTAIQTLKRVIDNPVNAPIRLHIIEKNPDYFGGGLAYGAAGAEHDVNVQAQYLSLDPQETADFVDWLKSVNKLQYFAENLGINVPTALNIPTENVEDTAVQRRLYKYYLLQRLHRQIHAARNLGLADVDIIIDALADFNPAEDGKWNLSFESGQTATVSHLVLATGHGPVVAPRFIADAAKQMPDIIMDDVWARRYDIASMFASPDVKTVVALGTGLSAMDIVKTALDKGFLQRDDAKLILVSRGGNLHPAINPDIPFTQPDVLLSDLGDLPRNAADVPGFIKNTFEFISARGTIEIGRPYAMDEVFYGLKPLIPEFIAATGIPVRDLFDMVRKYSSLINTTAVSMTALMGGIMDEYAKTGHITVASMNTMAIVPGENGGVDLVGDDGLVIEADGLISTLPPQSRPDMIPVYKNAMDKGLLQTEIATGFGLEVGYQHMQGVARDGTVHETLYVVGPISGGEAMQAEGLIGPSFQTVGGLRDQARKVADSLTEQRIGMLGHKPCVGILMNSGQNDGEAALCARWKHAIESFGMQVVLIPPAIKDETLQTTLSSLDGVLLTGGDANVHPSHYGQDPIDGQTFDPIRDETAFKIIRHCHNNAVPLMGICRGAQEINVALGGTLQQRVDGHDQGYASLEARDQDAHGIHIVPGGDFEKWYGRTHAHHVTSVHRQGMTPDDLAPSLRMEAIDDAEKLVEAFTCPTHMFMVGVQYHPEFNPMADGYRVLFDKFTRAARVFFKAHKNTRDASCTASGATSQFTLTSC